MSYRNQLQLSFSPGSFSARSAQASTQQKTPIELRFRSDAASQLSPIALLVLKSLQHHVAGMRQSTTAPKQLLRFVSEAWNNMLNLEDEARMLEFCGVTKLKRLEVVD